MRSDAKASTAGSNTRQAGKLALPAFFVALLALLFVVGPATAQAAGPSIVGAWSEDVVRTEATLKAEINPEGQATTYHFDYGLTSAYGSETPEIGVGSDSSPHRVTSFLTGLQPGTTYHYRLTATSGAGEDEGPDQTFVTYANSAPLSDCPNQLFRTGPAAALPDCRAYEMVSPLDKNGGDIITQIYHVLEIRTAFNESALDGDKLTYSSGTAFAGQASARGTNQYLATRGPGGWTTRGINAPLGHTLTEPTPEERGDFQNQFKLFTPDLSSAWIGDENKTPLTADAPEGFAHVYRRDNLANSYEALTTAVPTSFIPPSPLPYPEIQGQSRGASHVIFSMEEGLTPDAATTSDLQVYDHTGGGLHLVSVMPDGTTATQDASAGLNLHPSAVPTNDYLGMMQHVVSDDGSRVFWTLYSVSQPAGSPEGSIYVRENPGEPQSALNGSDECTEPDKACTRLLAGGGHNEFWAAGANGGQVIYTQGAANGPNVYTSLNRVDVDTGAVTQIAGQVGGVVGTSEDASYVYFTSREALAPGAVAGEWNLYLDHEGAKSFVATLGAEDHSEDIALDGAKEKPTVDARSSLAHTSRVTPDGKHLAFQSVRSLTGYDNTDVADGRPLIEVYLYDAGEAKLECVSCKPSGARPSGQELWSPYYPRRSVAFPNERWGAAWLQSWVHNVYQSRALSDDGTRLYFNAYDALVPEDGNGAQDVYQWEAQGTGSCEPGSSSYSPANGGCISLISTGASADRSEFVDATPDGSTVFFETNDGIDPRDAGLIDIYAARENGGFPLPSSPPECAGDACQDVPPAPRDPTPASASFRGAGDPAPRRNCTSQARRTAKLNRQAERLLRMAARSDSPRRAGALRRRSADLAQRATRISESARRCRRANRGAAR